MFKTTISPTSMFVLSDHASCRLVLFVSRPLSYSGLSVLLLCVVISCYVSLFCLYLCVDMFFTLWDLNWIQKRMVWPLNLQNSTCVILKSTSKGEMPRSANSFSVLLSYSNTFQLCMAAWHEKINISSDKQHVFSSSLTFIILLKYNKRLAELKHWIEHKRYHYKIITFVKGSWLLMILCFN